MSFLQGIIGKGVGEIVEGVGNAFDNNFTSQEERLKAKSEVIQKINDLYDVQAKLIQSETQGNGIQKAWRPIVMLAFAFIVFYAYFLQPAFFPNAIDVRADLPVKFWELLEFGLGGYVIGRTAEKIAGSLGNKIKFTK